MRWGALEISGAVVVIGGAIALIVGFMRWLARTGKNVADLKDDLLGEPARPGVPARPGIMERVARIEGELTLNGGRSLKDAVMRMERKLDSAQPVVNVYQASPSGSTVEPASVPANAP